MIKNITIEYEGQTYDVAFYYEPACPGDNITPPMKETIEIVSLVWYTCDIIGNGVEVNVYSIIHVSDLEKIEQIISSIINDKPNNKWKNYLFIGQA